MENNFLFLDYHWDRRRFPLPGYKLMYLNEDGSFVTEKLILSEKTLLSGEKNIEKKQGKIDEAKMIMIKSFLEKNITENTGGIALDANQKIKYKKGDKEVIVMNNFQLWKELMKLIPEFVMDLDE